MSEYNIIHIGYRRYICKENEDPISAEEIVGRLNELEQRLATQKKAIDALHEFAQSVAGGSSWWDDVWPDIEKELEAGGEW